MSGLIERISKYKDNRGMMANLRCILVDNKKHRAWPALHRVGVAIGDDISAYVCGLYAIHPEETSIGNFGSTCKQIEKKRGERSDDDKLTPTERRFQHLLIAEKGDELNTRVLRMVLMAKSQGVPVNYNQLKDDMKDWSDRNKRDKTKREWATHYWTPNAIPDTEEDA
jgi:CRISPR system Cascade subunit CasB